VTPDPNLAINSYVLSLEKSCVTSVIVDGLDAVSSIKTPPASGASSTPDRSIILPAVLYTKSAVLPDVVQPAVSIKLPSIDEKPVPQFLTSVPVANIVAVLALIALTPYW